VKPTDDLGDHRINKVKMVTDLFAYEDLKTSPNFLLNDFKDSYYLGEADPVKNDRSGNGICIYLNERYYEGAWKKDKRHGKGYEKFSNGNIYFGDYENGKVCGKGLYCWTNGD